MSYLRRGVATATVSVFASLGPPLATGAACHIDERQRLMGSSSTRATEESVNRPERQSYLMCFVTSSSCLGRHLHLCICLRGGGVRLHLPWLRSACQLLLVTVEEPEQRCGSSAGQSAGAPAGPVLQVAPLLSPLSSLFLHMTSHRKEAEILTS